MELAIEAIPMFASLPPRVLLRVRDAIVREKYPAGAVLLRQGDAGRFFHAVASGAVLVSIEGGRDHRREFSLGPGETFGEMGILSGMPVSATITAIREVTTYSMSSLAFLALISEEPDFQQAVLKSTLSRLRDRTDPSRWNLRRACVVLCCVRASEPLRTLGQAVFRLVKHYAPSSQYIDTTISEERFDERITRWRHAGDDEAHLVIFVDGSTRSLVAPSISSEDVVLSMVDGSEHPPRLSELADHAVVTMQRSDDPKPERAGRWAHTVRLEEAEAALHSGSDAQTRPRLLPGLNRVARWITRREVGVALGAGAARGLAHLGVLETLEDAGIPIDFTCGSSMGGVVALLYGVGGSAAEAIRIARETMSTSAHVRDLSWFPRASLLVGKKVERASRRFASLGFCDLHCPVAVMSADLIRGEPVVLDEGSIQQALLATSAIPGVFPPVRSGDRMLVDGGLVSRIPAHLLESRRCGLRIAVHVVPSPQANAGDSPDGFARRSERLFGLREVIGRSWDMLAWWHGALEASSVDVLLEPTTGTYSANEFDRIEELIESGRIAARDRISEIKQMADRMLARVQPSDRS